MSTPKLVWKVAEALTGRYRSFSQRGWPTCTYGKDGAIAAWILCTDSYDGARGRGERKHAPLEIVLAHHQHPEAGSSWKRIRLARPAATLAEAKERIAKFLELHPEYAPKIVNGVA